jgi:signal transduction histidine kinase
MTSVGSSVAGRASTAFTAVWSAPTRRAVRNAAAGLPLAVGGMVLIAAILVSWVAAVLSLVEGPTGGWGLAVFYAVVAVGMPIPMLWLVHGWSAIQRARLRAVLGVTIGRPARQSGRGPWPIGPWRSASTWRQLSYHLLAFVIGGGAALALACWCAPVLAIGYVIWRPSVVGGLVAVVVAAAMTIVAAPLAHWVARADESAARTLLGPSRSDELARQVESLARIRTEIVAATDAERRRIERDLHDGAQQRLVSLAMNLGMARAAFTDSPEPVRQAIAEAHEEAILALTELRAFIRGLHPAVLNDRGLDAALSGIAARAPLPVRLRVDVEPRCSASVEAVAYFIVSEALTNVAKYAQATRAEVTVTRIGAALRIVVSDDGCGGAAVPPDDGGGGASSGTGLRGLMQRAASVEGTLTIDSPTGGPTIITAELPCES